MDHPSSCDPSEWRDRYLQALDDLQRYQRKGKDAEALFANVVSRVATSVIGFDEGMDEQLLRIQALLKGGSLSDDDLCRELDRISTEMFYAAVVKFDSAGTPATQRPLTAPSPAALFDALAVLMASKEEQAALQALREQLEQKVEADESDFFGQLRSGLAGILSECPAAGERGKAVRVGPFRRLLKRIRRDHEQVDLATVKLNLLALLQAVDMPIAGPAQVDRLRDRLRGEGGKEVLAILFHEFADLLGHLKTTIQSEHRRIEEFLSDLNGTLLELEERAIGVQGLTREYECGSASFRTLVSGQMEPLVGVSDTANDLQALKKLLKAKVDVMTGYLNTASEVQNSAVRKTAVLVDQIAGRLKELDADVAELRTQLRTEHAVAYRDVVTGLPNRMAFDERIGQDIQRWNRFKLPFCLLLWDIDQFKSINDRFGHGSGDNALIVIAEQLASSIRETDFVSRYGGDEFAMILAGTELTNAVQVCEKIRAHIEQCRFHTSSGVPVCITVSCGIAQLADREPLDRFFDRTDRALYQAKQEGRNRCSASGGNHSASPVATASG
ncbi:MAG: GGDEF domain-containing protein [Methylococcaceae bacterium]|nr:GGDEF domain-containing protein [Methylococcaceae bacterium]